MVDLSSADLSQIACRLGVPNRGAHEISAYLADRLEPHSRFINLLICNDLVGAVSIAGKDDLEALQHYAFFMLNYASEQAWGSVQKRNLWLKKEEITRSA